MTIFSLMGYLMFNGWCLHNSNTLMKGMRSWVFAYFYRKIKSLSKKRIFFLMLYHPDLDTLIEAWSEGKEKRNLNQVSISVEKRDFWLLSEFRCLDQFYHHWLFFFSLFACFCYLYALIFTFYISFLNWNSLLDSFSVELICICHYLKKKQSCTYSVLWLILITSLCSHGA